MEWMILILLLLIGFTLGVLYFGGLWLTVKMINSVRHPALWLLVSFILRIGILLITFYWIVLFNWWYIGVALISFLVARTWVIGRLKPDHRYPPGEHYGI